MRLLQFILLSIFCAAFSNLSAANRYWVAASSSNWNNTANWSATSGGAGGAGVPSAADLVFFNSLGLGDCTLDVPVVITSINVNVSYTSTITQGVDPVSISATAIFSGGTFTGGTGDIDITGAFTLSGANFISTTGVLVLRNNSAFTSGNFTHNNGTVSYNCTAVAAQTISGVSPIFNILEFVGLARTYTISSTGNITVISNLIISGAANCTLNTGGIDVQGDVNISNTAAGGGGTALINIIGTGNQNINGSSASTLGALPRLTINKSSGTLFLNNFIVITNNFIYTAGSVNAGTSTISFARGSVTSFAITGSITLNNITFVANTALTTTINAATILTANGNLSIDGTANMIINTGTINVNGDILLTNTATAGGGSTTINITGTGNQLSDGSALSVNQSRLPKITINKPSGILSLAGNLTFTGNVTYTAGAIDPTTSTVYIANSLSLAGSFNLYNVFINSTAAVTLTITTGSIITALNDVTIANNALVVNINTGTLAVQGNLVITNTATTAAGSGTILFNGTGTQNIMSTGIISQGRLPAVTINKTSGTLTFPSLITVMRNWTYTAGTLDVTTNNSTVVFSNSLTISGSHSLNNIIFNGAAAYTYTIPAATTLTALGDMSITGAGNVTLNTGNINLNGNLNLTNTATGGGGTTVISFVSSANQAIVSSLAIDQSKLPGININKASGTLTFPGIITVKGNWTYTNGTLDVTTNNSTVVFENTQTITGSHALNNITFNGAAAYTMTIAVGSTITALGDMNITGAGNVILNTGTINLNGNLNLNNTATAGGGTTNIAFVSSANQAIVSALAIDQSRLPGITINKPSGTLTLPGIITVRGNWTYTTGTLDATTNNSTVVFANTLSVTDTHTLNNLTLEGSGNYTFTVNTGTILTVSGTLLTTSTGALVINTPVAGATAIASGGDITLNNTSVSGGGTGAILINGTGAQSLTDNAAAGQGRLPYLTIQKTSGTLSLSGIISVSRNWTYTSGAVDPASSTVVFGGNNLTVASTGMNFNNLSLYRAQ